jgi:hypothetical protein
MSRINTINIITMIRTYDEETIRASSTITILKIDNYLCEYSLITVTLKRRMVRLFMTSNSKQEFLYTFGTLKLSCKINEGKGKSLEIEKIASC